MKVKNGKNLIIVPGNDNGFVNEFCTNKRWFTIRMEKNYTKSIDYIAIYRLSPISGITHYAKIKNIVLDKKKKGYIIFTEDPIELPHIIKREDHFQVRKHRYSTIENLLNARNLGECFSKYA